DVQPIFQASCYSCHAGEKPKAQLRLDAKTLAMKGGISGPVILPGNSEGSRLVHRVLGLHNETRMPLKGEPLSSAQIAVIRRWIDAGAVWPDDASAAGAKIKTHWAFIAPVRPPLPSIKNRAWVQNPIDRFILARLERERLMPSPAASKQTLARRLSLDLTGLPPTIEEVDRFVADRAPDAYEKLVERLLSSPHYGERWGRHWLDAARYADSDGYEKDKTRQAWFYRDWVINALNRDLPYDRFIIEQLAGDLLPGAAQDQVVATGFLRNSMVNEEGGVDPEQFRMEAMFDRMDAIGKSVLGITIQCAQCHTHKYDPIKHDEYYRMFAFLNNSHEANVAVYTPEEQIKRAEIFGRTREIEADLQHRTPEVGKPSFANNCLLARRLVERGVRFVQLYHEAWDQHGNLVKEIKKNCQDTDQASAALIKDLKQRGMLDDTLVIWGGEFGRTPMVQGGDDGRDHHPNAFTMWLAGGGIKAGQTIGQTDDLGFNVVEDRVHVHDLHATILHLLGFDHTKLTHRSQGRDFRLTDVHGEVVKKLLA
ncbi:MAG: DUF1549 domain-containing protein, partial [Pyrinomonadaceae bacterium]|nr:DUF1549 domain-containing protein [Pyrinomonadaceae bacterium]